MLKGAVRLTGRPEQVRAMLWALARAGSVELIEEVTYGGAVNIAPTTETTMTTETLTQYPKAKRTHTKKPQLQEPPAVEMKVEPLPEQPVTVLATIPVIAQPKQEPKPPAALKQTEFAYKGYRLLASGRGSWSVRRKDDSVVEYDGKSAWPLVEAKQVANADVKN